MTTYILMGLVFVYAAFVIYRKIKDMKNGNFCGCESCGDCGKGRQSDK